MRKLFVLVILCTAIAVRADDDARAILEAARVNPLGNPISLSARLRAGTTSVPFEIRVRDGKVVYAFENPEQEILLGLGEDAATLEERRGGRTAPVAPARFDESVRGGLLTYEDLALRFLYWPNPKLVGEESIRSFKAYKIEIPAPRGQSQYGVVRVWISRDNGAILRMEGYDSSGRLAKRFEVVSAQKLDGQWMLRQMRVERIDPETRKVTGRTYLEVTGRAAG